MIFRQEIRSKFVYIFYIIFCFFLINRIFFSSSHMAERTMSVLLYPFLKIQQNVRANIDNRRHNNVTQQQLRQELQTLSIEYDVLKGRNAQLQAQQIFLQDTAELIEYARRYQADGKQISKILMHSYGPQQDFMFIEGGQNKNFIKDDIVVYQNALIGRVIEAFAWYSKVVLITDARCRVAAQVQSNIGGICCGKNDKTLELCFVPHYKPVNVGELVISTGQGLLYPQGFVLGVVSSVKTDLVAHDIQVKPAYDVTQLSYVYVLHYDHQPVAQDAQPQEEEQENG